MYEMRPRKRSLYQKLRSWQFVYIAYMQIISTSREVASPQFPNELSTTMFVVLKSLNFTVEYVEEKF